MMKARRQGRRGVRTRQRGKHVSNEGGREYLNGFENSVLKPNTQINPDYETIERKDGLTGSAAISAVSSLHWSSIAIFLSATADRPQNKAQIATQTKNRVGEWSK